MRPESAYNFTETFNDRVVDVCISQALTKDLEQFDNEDGSNDVLINIWTQFSFWLEAAPPTDAHFLHRVDGLDQTVQVTDMFGEYILIEYEPHYEIEFQSITDDGSRNPELWMPGKLDMNSAIAFAEAFNAMMNSAYETLNTITAEVYICTDSGEFENVPF